jgi:hydrogenase maturation protein HypF
MAVSYLVHHFGREFLNCNIPFVRELDRPTTGILLQIAENHIHSPLTSSCGRLFDAVAALTCVRAKVNYEAQAAIELENVISLSDHPSPYHFALRTDGPTWIIDTCPMFEQLIHDLLRNTPVGVISRRFHDGVVDILARAADQLREKTWLDRVCLSGGTFHNVYLTGALRARLTENGFDVYMHQEVPAGDGGLSLGQAAIAAHRLMARVTDS